MPTGSAGSCGADARRALATADPAERVPRLAGTATARARSPPSSSAPAAATDGPACAATSRRSCAGARTSSRSSTPGNAGPLIRGRRHPRAATVVLSKPLGKAIFRRPVVDGRDAQVLCRSTRSAPPQFEETAAGWIRYVDLVIDFVTSAYGSDEFDVEIWNELSFGSDFIFGINRYGRSRRRADENPITSSLAVTLGRSPAGASRRSIGDPRAHEGDLGILEHDVLPPADRQAAARHRRPELSSLRHRNALLSGKRAGSGG